MVLLGISLGEVSLVHEALGALDVREHPVDEKNKARAKNEKWQINAEGGCPIERLQGILK